MTLPFVFELRVRWREMMEETKTKKKKRERKGKKEKEGKRCIRYGAIGSHNRIE